MLNFAFANRLRSAPALLLGLAALALPATAAAAPKDADQPPDFSVSMQMRGTHGYVVGIGADDHRTVSITASKGDAFATYTAPGRATSEGIEADFGKLGRVSVRFTPAGKSASRKRGCGIVKGHFDGVIRFRGELGYTQVIAKSARGELNPPGLGRRCATRPANRPGVDSHPSVRGLLTKAAEPDFSLTALGAVAHVGGRSIVFYDVEANEIRADGAVEPFLIISIGGTDERRGRILISRAAVLVPGRTVTLPSPPGQVPQTATVKAPKPFQGTAAYLAAPGVKPTWTGDLSVPLPGAGLVPLAGPEFDALLCTGPPTKATEACVGDIEDLLGDVSSLPE